MFGMEKGGGKGSCPFGEDGGRGKGKGGGKKKRKRGSGRGKGGGKEQSMADFIASRNKEMKKY